MNAQVDRIEIARRLRVAPETLRDLNTHLRSWSPATRRHALAWIGKTLVESNTDQSARDGGRTPMIQQR